MKTRARLLIEQRKGLKRTLQNVESEMTTMRWDKFDKVSKIRTSLIEQLGKVNKELGILLETK